MKAAVLRALSTYQNTDGGFGHALEPDAWNPNSSPIQTWAATEILNEIAFTNSSAPIIKGILKYLESGQDFDGHLWQNTVESNNDYPHAQWWHTDSYSTSHTDYNPTAVLAGFIVRFADRNSPLFELGCQISQEAVAYLFTSEQQNDMHTIACYIRMMEYCEAAGVCNLFDFQKLNDALSAAVKEMVTEDTDKWKASYICKPSQFFNSKDSRFYPAVKNIAEYECRFISETQLEDGSWHIPWRWKDYPEEWAISKNYWKSNAAVLNMLYLKNFGML